MRTELLDRPQPLTLRMIGAVFWMGLLVYVVPQWFMHPVSFSPERAKTQSQQSLAQAQQVETSSTEGISDQTLPSEQTTDADELFIEHPLTITPPPVDPPKRLQGLYQPSVVGEVHADRKDRLKADAQPGKLAVQPPPIAPRGKVWVQVATYTQQAIAKDILVRLKKAGFSGHLIAQTNSEKRKLYVLRVGPYKTRHDGERVKQILDQRFKIQSIVIGK